MIDKELLEILACPATYQTLARAPAELVQKLNLGIAQGTVRSVGGEVASLPLEDGLVRADGTVVYPIRDGIPVLLESEGLRVHGTSQG